LADEIRRLSSHVHPPVPNPAPLGLIAFGLTTALLQVKHTRLAGEEESDGVDNLVLGFALCFGGLIQLIAGISEIRRNNIFGYTAFCVYGGFWMSVGTLRIVELLAAGDTSPHVSPKASQAMLSIMAVVTAMLWSLTFKINKTICMLFFLLFMTFILLAVGVFNETVDQIGGYVGILTSANAFWIAFAELVNDVIGEGTDEIIPLGHWKTNKFKKAGGAHVPGLIHGSSRPQEVSLHQLGYQADLEEELDDIEEGLVNK
jgi:succinate-acetate transporter protein